MAVDNHERSYLAAANDRPCRRAFKKYRVEFVLGFTEKSIRKNKKKEYPKKIKSGAGALLKNIA